MNYRYAYERTGGPMSWRNGPPDQSRAAETRGLGAIAVPGKNRISRQSLGSLSEPTLGMPLPAPGAPEPLNGYNSPRSGPPGPFGADPQPPANPLTDGQQTARNVLSAVSTGVAVYVLYRFIQRAKKA